MKYDFLRPAEWIAASVGIIIVISGAVFASIPISLVGAFLLLICNSLLVQRLFVVSKKNEAMNRSMHGVRQKEQKKANFDEFISNSAQMTTNKALHRFLVNNYSKYFPINNCVILYAADSKVFRVNESGDQYLGKFDEIKDLVVYVKQKIFEKKTSSLADTLFGERHYTSLSVFTYKLDENKYYFHLFDAQESLDTDAGQLVYNVLYSVQLRNYLTTIWQHERRIKELFRGILEIFITASTEEHIIETATALLKQHVSYDRLDILLLNSGKTALRSILYPSASFVAEDSPLQDIITAANAKVLELKKSVFLGPDSFKRVHTGIREKYFTAMPLYFKDNIIGVVDCIRFRDEEFTQADMVLLDIFVKMLSAVLDKIEYVKEQEFHARYDGLTGILNRRAFFEKIEEEYLRYKRYSGTCAVLMLDIDHFKKFNDMYGHAAGDLVLKKTAEIMKSSVRESDYLGRYGGEEFVVFLHSVQTETAQAFAERLRKAIAAARYVYNDISLQVSVSIGVAVYPSDSTNILELLKFADTALYESKKNGRNMTTMYAASVKE